MDQANISLLISGFLLIAVTALAGVVVLALPEKAPHLLLMIGALLMAKGGSKINTARKKTKWPKVVAVLRSVDEDEFGTIESEYQKSPRQYSYPVVEYEYEIDGKSFRSTKVSDSVKDIAVPAIGNFGSKIPDSEKFWHTWVKGTNVTAYVNPKDPSDAVLVPQLPKKRKSHYVALVVSGVLLLLCWGGLLWTT